MSATPISAAVYCRISSDPTGLAAGVRRQEVECRKLAQRRGWAVADVLVDNDTSATAQSRPAWEQLLAGVRSRQYGAVIAWHPDRMMRSLKGLADLLSAVQENSTLVATVNAGDVDLATATGRLHASIVTAVAAHEREHTGERVKASQRQRRENGLPMGRVAWGWQADRMTADPVLAAALGGAVEAVAAGASLRSVAAKFTEDGLAAPAGGDGWDADSVRAVLLRPSNRGSYRDGRRGAWEPLITVEEDALVRSVLNDPARRTTGVTSRTRLLGGLARCALHEDPMYARYQARLDRWVYTPRTRQCCSVPVIEADRLVEAAVLAFLEREGAHAPAPGEDAAAVAELDDAQRAAERIDVELAAGRLGERRWATLNAAVSERVARAEAALRGARSSNVLTGVTGSAARAVWPTLPVTRRAAVIDELVTVRVNPGRRGVRVFDPARLVVARREH